MPSPSHEQVPQVCSDNFVLALLCKHFPLIENPIFKSAAQKKMVRMSIERIQNFVAVMSTGGGKSLSWLLPAWLDNNMMTVIIILHSAFLDNHICAAGGSSTGEWSKFSRVKYDLGEYLESAWKISLNLDYVRKNCGKGDIPCHFPTRHILTSLLCEKPFFHWTVSTPDVLPETKLVFLALESPTTEQFQQFLRENGKHIAHSILDEGHEILTM
ncbi:hypothetical protein M422DRAFT_262186 [Sphaerobolus stellatus SS14]|uniref:Unplaced genomic scaffold SPHSTscaffold_112, whole genome shotgun sequence n=1 Tax=Sphaerobolus stellatus (strain SS14) TaxID=990650 RepID=A0A0C9VDC9_SPHS4|nr:hypothetical protein M422DRAFT_262186 [Sphaerobolus stellatus SS14]